MKRILLIGTGGTIASEATGDGLAPELTSQQLLEQINASGIGPGGFGAVYVVKE